MPQRCAGDRLREAELGLLLDESRAPGYDLASRQAEIKDVCSIPESAGPFFLAPLDFVAASLRMQSPPPVYWRD
jgi:hypothetical protein